MHQILSSFWWAESESVRCFYVFIIKKKLSSHVLIFRHLRSFLRSKIYILFYYEGRKLQCYCRNIDINGCRDSPSPISSSRHVICPHDISLQNRMGAIKRRRQMERARRNKHPDGSCWNSELFLMYGPITQPFLFSLTLCNYFSQTWNTNHAETEWLETGVSLNNHNGQLGSHSKVEILTIQLISRSGSQLESSNRYGGIVSRITAQGRHGAHRYLLFLIVCFTF